MAVTAQDVSNWFAANPNATPQQVANAIASAGGLTPTISSAVAQQYGTTPSVIAQQYSALTQPSAPVQAPVQQSLQATNPALYNAVMANLQGIADESFGGKVQPYQTQIVSPIDPSKINAPKQLEREPAVYQTIQTEEGPAKKLVSGGGFKNAMNLGPDPQTGDPLGYVSTTPTYINQIPIVAKYDNYGKLTGYTQQKGIGGELLVTKTGGKGYVSGNWDASGNPAPIQGAWGSGGGFLGNNVGTLATLAALYGGANLLNGGLLGGLEGGALPNLGATDASLGAAGAVNAGLAGGALPASTVAGGLLGGATSPLATAAGTAAGTALSPAVASALAPVAGSALSGLLNPQTIQGGISTAGNIIQSQADKQAALQAQKDILSATQQAATGAQFRPVGVTTRFGTSQFQIDPKTGQLVSAGYTASPEIVSAQNQLMKLGAGYLKQTPQEVAQQYMTQQAELLDPLRQRQLADIRNQIYQTGRGGLSVGSTGLRPSGAQGLMGANPELEAYYNAIAQQNAQLAAQAQQAGQQQVGFGAGLFGQAGQLEQLAQQPFTLGTGLGTSIAQAGGTAGQLGIAGTGLGARFGTAPTATTNPFATILGGAGSPTSTLGQGLFNWLTSNIPSGGGAGGGITSPLMQNPIADIYGSGNVPLGYANF